MIDHIMPMVTPKFVSSFIPICSHAITKRPLLVNFHVNMYKAGGISISVNYLKVCKPAIVYNLFGHGTTLLLVIISRFSRQPSLWMDFYLRKRTYKTVVT